ncbi:MAG: winged helix-turn-helix domain-containing protein [Vallitaleaceae bacterium]|nr:winged helix-turn-helix domain-containing protein [Vallitaleaceae bacterium]
MPKRYQISKEQIEELETARKVNKGKNVENRIKALMLRAQGKQLIQIAEATEYHPAYVSKLVSIYCNQGLSAIIENHYTGNRRNMSFAEEATFLSEYKKLAEKGQIVEVGAIKKAYEEKVGHVIGKGQIYRVLERHGWRKIMPRSKHPNKASDEVIDASKKLTLKSEK